MNQALSYDTPRRPTPTDVLHRIAQLCGLIPLGIGTFIFVVFLFTRDVQIAMLGFITILVGIALAVVGIVCAVVYLFQAHGAEPFERDRAKRRAHRDIAIIISNFLIAFVMAWIGTSLLPPAFD